MLTLKDEIKELELIQKELEQARADVLRLEIAEQETLQSIKDIKEEELQRNEEDDNPMDYWTS